MKKLLANAVAYTTLLIAIPLAVVSACRRLDTPTVTDYEPRAWPPGTPTMDNTAHGIGFRSGQKISLGAWPAGASRSFHPRR